MGKDAQGQEGVKRDQAGKPSEEGKATDPQDGGKIDLANEVLIDPKTGEKVLFGELVEGYKRGRGADKLQGQLHKERAEREKIAKERAELAQRLQQMEKEQENKKLFAEMASEFQPKEKDDDWLTEEAKIDPEEIARRMESTTTKVLDDKLGNIDEIIEQRLQAIREREQAERAQKENVQMFRKIDLDIQKQDWRDQGFTESEIEHASKLAQAAEQKRVEAEYLFVQGKQDESQIANAERRAWESEVQKLQVDATIRKRQEQREEELAEQIESGQILDVQVEEPEEEKRDWRPETREKKKRLRRERWLKEQEQKERAAQALGISLPELERRLKNR